ncbi:MAG TPA: DinB family protein [Thermoanaerobaculia bacterium]|nr:DinB family protein [Thermoanaerobaculia bacterium]
MRHVRLLPLCLLFVSAAAIADDRADLLAHLQRTNDAFLASVAGLTEAQWNYRAGEGRWTIAEVAEHIAASEEMMLKGTLGVIQDNATPEALKDARKDEMLIQRIPDRTSRFQAPEVLRPTNRFGSAAGSVAAFRKSRAEMMALAKERPDLRNFAAPHPVTGNLDAHGWLLFQSAHSERHTKQIEEVKADPGFPK